MSPNGRTTAAVGLAGLIILAATAAFLAGRFVPAIVMAERWVADFRLATLLPPEPQHQEIVVVAITEDTLEQFPYRSPIDREFLADLLEVLQAREVRAIGIDILFDQPTEDAKDKKLFDTLRSLPIPMVVSAGGSDEGLSERQVEYLNTFVPDELRGFANLAKDPFDGAVRWIFPGRNDAEGKFKAGVMPLLATKLGQAVTLEQQPIAWRGSPDAETPAFRIIPAHAAAIVPADWLKGKIVLIGADLSLTDRHRTPFSVTRHGQDGTTAGVVIHAHALATLLDTREPQVWGNAFGLWVVIVAAVIGGLVTFIPAPLHVRLIGAGVVIAASWYGGFWAFKHAGVMVPLVSPTIAFGIATWLAEVYVSRRERQQKQFVRQAFSQYISPDLVNQLVDDPSKLALHGERRELSFLFTDVAGFTTLAEGLDPDSLTSLLNEYLDGVCSAIHHQGGTVCDFIGDAVFAVFGAPVHQPDHRDRAVACARAIATTADQFRASKREQGMEFGITRIGVHTGMVTVGNVGSSFRFKYAPVGDAVNTASRLEGLNKHFGTRTCVSAAALTDGERTNARPLGKIIVKGKSEPIEVFELLDGGRGNSDFTTHYGQAYRLLDAGEVEAARVQFEQLHQEAPNDQPVALHLTRIQSGCRNAVIMMNEK